MLGGRLASQSLGLGDVNFQKVRKLRCTSQTFAHVLRYAAPHTAQGLAPGRLCRPGASRGLFSGLAVGKCPDIGLYDPPLGPVGVTPRQVNIQAGRKTTRSGRRGRDRRTRLSLFVECANVRLHYATSGAGGWTVKGQHPGWQRADEAGC